MMMPMKTSIIGSTSESRRCIRVSICSSRKSATLLSISSSEPVASPTFTMSIDMSVKTVALLQGRVERLALAHQLDRRLELAAHLAVAHRGDARSRTRAPAGCRPKATSPASGRIPPARSGGAPARGTAAAACMRSSASRPGSVLPHERQRRTPPTTSASRMIGQLLAGELRRAASTIRVISGSSASELGEEAHELRHHVDRHDGDHGDRQTDQHRRVDQRRDHPPPARRAPASCSG